MFVVEGIFGRVFFRFFVYVVFVVDEWFVVGVFEIVVGVFVV